MQVVERVTRNIQLRVFQTVIGAVERSGLVESDPRKRCSLCGGHGTVRLHPSVDSLGSLKWPGSGGRVRDCSRCEGEGATTGRRYVGSTTEVFVRHIAPGDNKNEFFVRPHELGKGYGELQRFSF